MTVRQFVLLWIAVVFALLSSQTHAKRVDMCPDTYNDRVWSGTCFETKKASRSVRRQYLKKIHFAPNGHAAIVISSPPELLLVDRRGMIVPLDEDKLEGSFTFEPSDQSIARFGYRSGRQKDKFRCGFYRAKSYQIVVPPVYDECDEFRDGKALVCLGCSNYCESGDCHGTDLIGGEGIVINEQNEILRRFALPISPACRSAQTGNANKEPGDKRCVPHPNPFDLMK